MAKGLYTLLDLAERNGENIHALIEGVLTSAPELATVPCIPKSGVTYTTLTRTELPSGDFAKVGAGVAPTKSVWKRDVGSMAKFEAQMRVNEDILTISENEMAGEELVTGDFLADEALATLRGSAIKIGSQFWYGTKINPDGFAGIASVVDTANNQISAGAAANTDSSSVYLVRFADTAVNPQDVHMVAGNGGKMGYGDTWLKQQVPDPNDLTKLMTCYCNNFLSFLGLVVPRVQSVYRVVGINEANPFTDATMAGLWKKVPLALRDKTNFKVFTNQVPLYTLQASRATVQVATDGKSGVGRGGVFPDVPEEVMGIEIVPTDSLVQNERNGQHQ